MSEVPVVIQGFKGINLREPAGMVQDDELVTCENFNIGRAGELTKRTGFAQLHNGNTLGLSDVRLLGHFLTPTLSQIIAATDSDIWSSPNGADWTKLNASPIVAKAAVQYVNTMYIATDAGIYSWDGTTLALIADSPVGTFCLVYKDRLYVLSTTATNNSRLYFSAIADFETWPSTNFLDINPGDGDFLTSCAIIQDLLLIFKTGTSWALYVQGAPQNWVLRNINPEIGCISSQTPREIEGFLFFVGTRGIYKTDGNIFEDISESIEPLFRERIVNLTTVNIDAASWWEDRFIVLLHPTPSVFRYLVYHLRTGGWTEWVPAGDIRPSAFLEINSASPTKGLYTGNSNTDGKIYRHGDGALTDKGVSYTCKFKTKDFDFTLPSLMKRGKWLGIDVHAGTGNIAVRHTVDSEDLAALSFPGGSARRLHKVEGPGYFRVWAVEMEYLGSKEFTFYSTTLWMHQKRSTIKAAT